MKKINKFVYLNLLFATLAVNPAHAFGPKKDANPAAAQPAPAPKPVTAAKPTPAPKVKAPIAKSPVTAASNTTQKVSEMPTKPTAAIKPEAKPIKVSKPKPVRIAKPKIPVVTEKPVEVAEVLPAPAPSASPIPSNMSISVGDIFNKIKSSVKNGASEPTCDFAAKALNQC